MSFFNKLETAIACNNSLLVVGLDPNREMLPDSYCLNHNDNGNKQDIKALQEWLLWVIEQTKSYVCAYKPTLGFYQALGASGLELLEKILPAIPENIPIILDAKHGDLNTSNVLAQTVFARWQVDSITLNPYSGQDIVAPFLVYLDKAVLNAQWLNQYCFPNPI